MSSSVVLQPAVSLCFMNDDKKHQLWQVICWPHRYTQWDSQFYISFGSPVYLVWLIVRGTLERKCVCLYILGVFQQILMNLTLCPFFFFFSRRYNPSWVLACFTILFHNLLSLHFSLQFLNFIFFRSSSTWSSHLSLGLPTGLDEHGSHSVSFLTVLVVFIRITCTTQRNLCDFINLTIHYVPALV